MNAVQGKWRKPQQRVKFCPSVVEHYRDRLKPTHYVVLKSISADMTYELAATTLSLPIGTVKSRANRGAKVLRDLIAHAVATDLHQNGAPKWTHDGTLLDDKGNRSIFDDLND